MTEVSWNVLRQNSSHYLDQAIRDKRPLTITCEGKKEKLVLMSEAEFSSLKETAYLMGNPKNAERLLRNI